MFRVVLAQPRGFCAGVERAIEIVERALKKYGPPIYVRHEIVHNRHVVERFIKQGVIFVDSIDDVPAKCTVVFSAHGVSPEVRNSAAARGCTRTCVSADGQLHTTACGCTSHGRSSERARCAKFLPSGCLPLHILTQPRTVSVASVPKPLSSVERPSIRCLTAERGIDRAAFDAKRIRQ